MLWKCVVKLSSASLLAQDSQCNYIMLHNVLLFTTWKWQEVILYNKINYKILLFFSHTEDNDSLTGLVWIPVVFVWMVFEVSALRVPYTCVIWTHRDCSFICERCFFFHRRKKVIYILDGMRVSKLWENINFWVEYLFKLGIWTCPKNGQWHITLFSLFNSLSLGSSCQKASQPLT